MAISEKQIRAARALIGLSQATLAKLAGVSVPRIIAVEAERDCLQSTSTAIIAALESKGAVFSRDGGVRIAEKSEHFRIEPGQSQSPEALRGARSILNASRKSRGLAPLDWKGER
jgi:DNA-binding XRE family transcriptional regulator